MNNSLSHLSSFIVFGVEPTLLTSSVRLGMEEGALTRLRLVFGDKPLPLTSGMGQSVEGHSHTSIKTLQNIQKKKTKQTKRKFTRLYFAFGDEPLLLTSSMGQGIGSHFKNTKSYSAYKL